MNLGMVETSRDVAPRPVHFLCENKAQQYRVPLFLGQRTPVPARGGKETRPACPTGC